MWKTNEQHVLGRNPEQAAPRWIQTRTRGQCSAINAAEAKFSLIASQSSQKECLKEEKGKQISTKFQLK